MKRKALPLLFILIVIGIFLLAAPAGAEGDNLLVNGDFKILNNDGLPESWFVDAYRLDPGYSVFSMTEGKDGETSAILIQNTAKNDARLAQTVSVRPESLYCFSAYVRADGVREGHGANLSVEGLYAFSEKKYDTDGQWQKIEYYGETGPDQHEVTVFARVGGYSGESKGTAAFCNLSLEEVEGLPDGVLADLWYEPEPVYEEDEWTDEYYEEEERAADPAWPALTAVAVLSALIAFALIYTFRDGKTDLARSDGDRIKTGPVLLLALLIRLVISFLVEGYSVDVNCFLSWGATMAQNGPAGFYQATSFCDYPPLYTYVIGVNSWLSNITGADTSWTRVIFRLIPCLCDVAACGILLSWAKQKENRKDLYTKAVLLLLAFNPVTIINSAAWGQMDSVLCLLLLGVAVFAVEGKWPAAIALYVTAVLVKPQALMLGFLGLAYMILAVIRDRSQLKKILIGVTVGAALMVVYILPFGLRQQPGWLIQRYIETLSSYPYATVNTANFYYLLGGNWNAIGNPAHLLAPILFAAACALHGVLWYLKNRDRKHAWIESALAALFVLWFVACAVFRLSWSFVGIGAMAWAFVIVISMAVRNGEIRFLPYLGALLFILLYVFGVKMHERYLFPAFVLLMFAWVLQRDRRILYLLILFSSTVFINEGVVLDNSIRLGSALGHLNNDTTVLADILSVLNVLGAVLSVLLGYALMKGKLPGDVKQLPSFLPIRKVSGKIGSKKAPDRKLHWNKKDTVILLCITALFTVLTLTTLGSTKAPQTAWTSSGEEEQVTFDLGTDYDEFTMLYFAQVSRENFKVATSTDGEGWEDPVWAQMDQGQCWKWKYVTQSWEDGTGGRTFYNDTDYIWRFSGRYVRITSCQVGLTLNEVIFRDEKGEIIPAKVIERTGETEGSALRSDPENLLDEQDTLENLPGFFGLQQEGEAQPSWWNSTYFDEIYHARTGFEFLNGTVPYETSHPPLGKIFISWTITLFGMTPFGWRFAGALAGILMLPGVYLLAKQLTKKTWPAAFACALMALDCMHLTQTQIATIDSFPVLFIIFAFFFMLRFAQTDLREAGLKKSLLPLACSGLFMGLSIASKWIGIYAGMGLAVIFFAHCVRQMRLGLPVRRFLVLCLWCVPFFVVVPLAIYLLSYIPYMAYNTRIANFGDFLAAVWRSQESMLSYHGTPGLGMDHPFYSPWWQWPIIGKPMYYASKQYLPADSAVSHSIFSFGNPVLWWGALPALLAAVFLRIRDRHYLCEGSEARWHLRSLSGDRRYAFVFVGLLAQYLPWVLVPRGTYIYHYFASIPFLILILSLLLTDGDEVRPKAARIAGGCFLGLAFVAFIIFLPYAAGMAAPVWWLNIGRSLLHIWY